MIRLLEFFRWLMPRARRCLSWVLETSRLGKVSLAGLRIVALLTLYLTTSIISYSIQVLYLATSVMARFPQNATVPLGPCYLQV